MKRMTHILFLGLVLSISSVALAGQGHDRNDNRGYYGDQRHHVHRHNRHDNRRYVDRRYVVRYANPAPVHYHHGRYCHDWHPNGYVAPAVRYGYGGPGLVIVYQSGSGLYLGGGR